MTINTDRIRPDEGRFAFVGGTYVESTGDAVVQRRSPVDGRELPGIRSCTPGDVDKAVQAARRAFEAKDWRGKTADEKKKILFRFTDLLQKHSAELALRDVLSMGKPIRDCLNNDIPLAIQCIRWYAEAMDKMYDACAPPHPGAIATITREPIGVVAGITPWNFPMENVAWKIGPALAAGNSLILKPAEQATFSALFLGKLAQEAGIPDGVLNILPGRGDVTGKALALHPDVDGVFFTGSTATGKDILTYAGRSNMKRVAIESGGKSAFLILKDCRHLDEAAQALAKNIFFNQGQICSAPSRLIVESSVQQEVLEKLLRLIPAYQPSNPLEEATTSGAMVDHPHLEGVLGYISAGRKEGGRLLVGGDRVEPVKGGAYMTPAIFTGVKNDMRIAREEIFGPVLSVLTVKDEQGAVETSNASPFGLAAAVWCDDINRAHRVARALRAGTIHINCYGEDDITAPFGGFKQSGNGHKEKSLDALDAYSEKKTTWLKLRED